MNLAPVDGMVPFTTIDGVINVNLKETGADGTISIVARHGNDTAAKCDIFTSTMVSDIQREAAALDAPKRMFALTARATNLKPNKLVKAEPVAIACWPKDDGMTTGAALDSFTGADEFKPPTVMASIVTEVLMM